jgi:hypothetical protein
MITMQAAVDRFEACAEPVIAIHGVTLLDPMGGGFAVGDLWLIAGGRLVGLTATALTLARELATDGIETVLAVGDTNVDMLTTKLVAARAQVASHHLEPGRRLELRLDEQERVTAAIEDLRALPLRLFDPRWSEDLDSNAMLSWLWDTDVARARVLVIDDADSWVRRLGPDIPGRLKDLAVRWDATVIALAHSEHPRPMRHKHPRDEWSLWERHLDATVILDRPDLHNPRSPRANEIDAYGWSTRAAQTQETFVFEGHFGSIARPHLPHT